MNFPKKFIWGVSTAAYQVEGAFDADGKCASIWDTYAHNGKCFENQNADVACDHYNRYKKDIKLMKELGVKSYRFSISWCRIIKNKNNDINEKGLQFYSNLIDELLKNGIEPMVTLFHWDLPEFENEQGAFTRRDIIYDFEFYVETVLKMLNGRVKYFNTINEAQSFLAGYFLPGAAPGLNFNLKEMLCSMHNLLLAHGLAVKKIREYVADAKIGFAMCGWIPCPVNSTTENIEVCKNKLFEVNPTHPTDFIGCFGDAIYLGNYPEKYYEIFKDVLPEIRTGDLELISQPLDFIAQNLYSGYLLDESGNEVKMPIGFPKNNCGWNDMPQSVYYGLKFISERYKLPIIITENGYSQNDRVSLDGKVHDFYRIDMFNRYLNEIKKAMSEGVNILGYYHWSFMDNFEWAAGFNQRFGLVYVNYQTQERIKKDSFNFYKRIIKSNGKYSK